MQAAQSIAGLTTETKQTTGDMPPPLVGASTSMVGYHLYVFGGRLVSSRQMTNHLYILDVRTLVWVRHIAEPDSADPPRPRYFHSANVYKNTLVIFGGMSQSARRASQGLCALDDICIFDLNTLTWRNIQIVPSLYSPQARYAHLATCAENKLVVMGGQDMNNQYIHEINVFDLDRHQWIHNGPLDKQIGAYRAIMFVPSRADPALVGHTAFWEKEERLNEDDVPVCVYSNYNFSDVTRELQSFHTQRPHPITFHDHSPSMTGAALPPGLRFPTGDLLGHHLLLTGTYLTPIHQSFHIWALNLANLVWVRIDSGPLLLGGSWNRGVLNETNQKLYVLGHRDRDLLEDYNHRQVNFDHLAIVDLEAFGIYSYPKPTCAPIAQELGLSMLNEPSMSDMEVFTADNKSIPANSSILAQRWPYFAKMLQNTRQDNKNIHKTFMFPETYSVTLAFLQFIYTDHLMTAQQHQPHILTRLLVIADIYGLPRLVDLASHALHQLLTISTASIVYETAALTCRTALQIRALRVMINAKKILQQTNEEASSQRNVSPAPAVRRLATSRSTTTPESDFLPIVPKPSKSFTMPSPMGNNGGQGALFFDRQRKGSLVPQQANKSGQVPISSAGRASVGPNF
ncbi:hypothetical protein CLU79DRAFT_728793 [Phycomyces nitens]|nr:hypothetical protein CLU79DRAFT_728793 [Phycomyces nitens]